MLSLSFFSISPLSFLIHEIPLFPRLCLLLTSGAACQEVGLDVSIPEHIRRHTPPFVHRLVTAALQTSSLPAPDASDLASFDFAVHPGGRSIVEGLADALSLSEEQLRHSWSVLSRFGNMSSATVLFVLDSLRHDAQRAPWCVALAFGPGLSIEGAVLRRPA
jgi:type III polyketide synthase